MGTQEKVSLNSAGRTNLIQWLARQDKRFHTSQYNVDVAVSQIEDHLLSTGRLDYELNSFDSVSGLPSVVCFNAQDFIYE